MKIRVRSKLILTKENINIVLTIIAIGISIFALRTANNSLDYTLKASYDAEIDFTNDTITITNVSKNYTIVKIDIIEIDRLTGYFISPPEEENNDYIYTHFEKSACFKFTTYREMSNDQLVFNWNDNKQNEILSNLEENIWEELNIGNFWISPSYYIMIEYQNIFGEYKKDYFKLSNFTRRESVHGAWKLNLDSRCSIDDYYDALINQYIYDDTNPVIFNELLEKLGLSND